MRQRPSLLLLLSTALLLVAPACLLDLEGSDTSSQGDTSSDVETVDAGPDWDAGSEDTGLDDGDVCTGSSECQDGYVCLPYSDDTSRCSAVCDTSSVYCEDGAHCLSLKDLDYGACASWGAGELDALCDGKVDCQRSLACFTDLQGDGRCRYTCDFSEELVPCPTGWACTITTGGIDFGECVEN